MKPRDRVLKVLRFEQPDRIPIELHNFLVCARLLGKPANEVFRNSELIAQSHLKAHAIFDHDMLLVEAGVATLAESCGCELDCHDSTAPWIKTPIFKDKKPKEIKALLKNLETPDPKKSQPLKIIVDAVKILLDKKGGELFIMGRADQGPFSLASELRGMNDFLLDVATEEDYIEDLIEYTAKVYYEYAKTIMEAGADATSMGESIGGPDVVAPSVYRKYALPYEKKVIKKLHEKGYIVSNHICGNANTILGDMIETGADILEIDEKTDLPLAAAKAKGKACLMGVVSPAILRNGTMESIRQETIRVIEQMKDNHGFILGPGCALSWDTGIDNIKTFVETGKEFGMLGEQRICQSN